MSEIKRGLEGWEIGVARKVVARNQAKFLLLKREGFEDLVSECLIVWIEKRVSCDVQSKSYPKSFMAKVIENHLKDIADRIYSLKRKLTYQSQSLEEYFEDEESDEPQRKHEPAALENLRLKVDISDAVENLTPSQKAVYKLLYEEGLSPLEASKTLKKHHSHVYRKIDRIRQLFEARGLREYLKKSSGTCEIPPPNSVIGE